MAAAHPWIWRVTTKLRSRRAGSARRTQKPPGRMPGGFCARSDKNFWKFDRMEGAKNAPHKIYHARSSPL